jgi:hypothetical protein
MKPPLPPDTRPIIDPDDPRSEIPGRVVRDDGTVFYWNAHSKKWQALKPQTAPNGFVNVRVRVGDRVRALGVARLVLRAFVGPQPLGFEPLHYPDSDPANNQ